MARQCSSGKSRFHSAGPGSGTSASSGLRPFFGKLLLPVGVSDPQVGSMLDLPTARTSRPVLTASKHQSLEPPHHADTCQLLFQPSGFMALKNRGLRSQGTFLFLQESRSVATYSNPLVSTSLWRSLGDPDSLGLDPSAWEGSGRPPESFEPAVWAQEHQRAGIKA